MSVARFRTSAFTPCRVRLSGLERNSFFLMHSRGLQTCSSIIFTGVGLTFAPEGSPPRTGPGPGCRRGLRAPSQHSPRANGRNTNSSRSYTKVVSTSRETQRGEDDTPRGSTRLPYPPRTEFPSQSEPQRLCSWNNLIRFPLLSASQGIVLNNSIK